VRGDRPDLTVLVVSGAEIVPLTQEHLEAAGALLADRHRRHRVAEPLLSARFEDAGTAGGEVAAAFRSEGASGAAAIRGGRLVGYLLGAAKPSTIWGENVWVESAGHALAENEPVETARKLYAEAAARWVAQGRTAHYLLLPSHDAALIGAWFRLAFGHQHTHALRTPAEPSPPPPHLVVRRAVRADIPVLAELDLELPRHQGRTPTFSSGPMPTLEESLAEWEEDFDDPDFTTFVVEHDGRVVGSAIACSLEESSINNGLMRPDHAGFLGFAAVRPDARGLGAGRALSDAVMAWALQQDYPVIATDWRETNLLSSRAWRGLGYRDSFVRLHRLVGH